MKICIVGAGAIGGFLGAKLAATGTVQVSALARGATREALAAHGWRLRQGDALIQEPLAAVSDDAPDLGVQDLVIIAVKGPALASVVSGIGALLGPNTIVLPAMNGVPWWFSRGIAALDDAPLASVDPGGHIAAAIDQSRVIGCVVHASTTAVEPGLVQHKMGQGLIIGEPDTTISPRLGALGHLLTSAGFDVTLADNIRYDIWYKLWGNLTMNPLSAMTGATTDRLLDDPLVRQFCSAAMAEAAAIGARIGCPVAQTAEDRHAVTRRLGSFKTSMLQDVEVGRQIELDSIVGAVQEIGRRLDIPTPNIDAIFGLTRLFARERDLYRPPVPA